MLPKAPLAAEYYAKAVWTGSELLVYQPNYRAGRGSFGAAYDPVRQSWRTLPSSPYAVASTEAGSQIVWDGTELLAFGVMNGAYNPSTGKWRAVKAPPLGGPSVVVWTGDRVLIWGGGCCDDASNEGAAYDPVTNTWDRLPTAPVPGRHAEGVWTGTEMVVVGGQAHGAVIFADAAAYNPRTNTWRVLPNMPTPRESASVTWTGAEVLVVGGLADFDGTPRDDGLAYNPATNQWRRLAAMPLGRTRHMATWTGHHLIVWGGQTWTPAKREPATPPHGLVYDPAADRWAALPKAPLKGRVGAAAVWTGTEMIIWGGQAVVYPQPVLGDGAAYVP